MKLLVLLGLFTTALAQQGGQITVVRDVTHSLKPDVSSASAVTVTEINTKARTTQLVGSPVSKSSFGPNGQITPMTIMNGGGLSNYFQEERFCPDSTVTIQVDGFNCYWVPNQVVPPPTPCTPGQTCGGY